VINFIPAITSNQLSFKASPNDLKFITNIRDRNVEFLDSLQKQKIETLLKYRDAKKIIELYQYLLNNYSNSGIAFDIISHAKHDMEEMKQFKDILWNKLREINLSILAEEEKNY